jgi:uncharacterized protein YfaT (DUF1175 family)
MPADIFRAIAGAALLALLLASTGLVILHRSVLAESARGAMASAHALHDAGGASAGLSWHDRLGDGFPDGARLDSAQDRENFTRWFTFLAETQYYSRSPRTRDEIQDCAALIRFAYRNSLVAHSPAWREGAALPYDPGFGDIAKYHYPYGQLGRALFRSRPGPAAANDLQQGTFVEFADSATLLRYNTYQISRDVRAAAPGDLLFFHQSVQREPFHTMLFVGKSYYQQQGSDWIVYHTGDMDGHRGEIREVQVETLLGHPDLHWRPLINNPNFLGVYRLDILH